MPTTAALPNSTEPPATIPQTTNTALKTNTPLATNTTLPGNTAVPGMLTNTPTSTNTVSVPQPHCPTHFNAHINLYINTPPPSLQQKTPPDTPLPSYGRQATRTVIFGNWQEHGDFITPGEKRLLQHDHFACAWRALCGITDHSIQKAFPVQGLMLPYLFYWGSTSRK